MNNKVFVLDTSVLLADPTALYAFNKSEVVLPLVVIKELEAKRNDSVLGWAARTALRALESFRAEGGNLTTGVNLDNGGTLRIELNHIDAASLPDTLRYNKDNDTRILAVVSALRDEGKDVTLVSNDLPLRLITSAVCEVAAEEYHGDSRLPESGYTGIMEFTVHGGTVDELYERKRIPLSAILPPDMEEPPIHTGVMLKGWQGGSALGVTTSMGDFQLISSDLEAFGVHGRSAEQRIALEHLMNPEIGCVSIGGRAGTGKTVLALAAGLDAVLERRSARRIIVFRPIIAVGGQELGYLPGSEDEKMLPWRAAVFDALRAITNDNVIDEVLDRNILEVLPLTHIRGRTLGPNDIIIVDEAQNLERNTIITALSRLGEGSRAFLLHDVAQRDNLRVGRNDGITQVVERLKGEPLFSHTELRKSERSPVAEMVTRHFH